MHLHHTAGKLALRAAPDPSVAIPVEHRWRRLLPRSILGLALIGFSLVALPLIVSLARAVFAVDDLVLRSERLVVQGIQVTRTSESLLEHLSDMERNARQYQVLGEADLLKLYESKHDQFRARVELLERLAPEGATQKQFDTLRDTGEAVLELLRTQPPHSSELAKAPPQLAARLLEQFATLKTIAVGLTNGSSMLVRQDLQTLFETASQARLELYWQSAALILGALFLGILFTVLIARPIRQLSLAIRGLGEGRLEQAIAVAGPPEISELGRQLDWLRQRLNESEAEKNRFLRHMSHEFKTPLASVREGSELLVDDSLGYLNDEQHEVAAIVRDNSLELERLIDNLLNFSAWREKRYKPALEQVLLIDLLERLGHKYRLALAAKQLVLVLPGEAAVVDADPSLLRAALDNLLSNAIKFTPTHGIVSFAVAVCDDAVHIDITDSGPGIAVVDRQRLFEPFYRGRAATGEGRGTGIGLSVAYECIAAHGGYIEVIDENHGAHFRIVLPKPPPSALQTQARRGVRVA